MLKLLNQNILNWVCLSNKDPLLFPLSHSATWHFQWRTFHQKALTSREHFSLLTVTGASELTGDHTGVTVEISQLRHAQLCLFGKPKQVLTCLCANYFVTLLWKRRKIVVDSWRGMVNDAGNKMEMWNAEIFPFNILTVHFQGYR